MKSIPIPFLALAFPLLLQGCTGETEGSRLWQVKVQDGMPTVTEIAAGNRQVGPEQDREHTGRPLVFLDVTHGQTLRLSGATQQDLPGLVKHVLAAVVLITTYDEYGGALTQASGFFIGRAGELVTNYHVLRGARFAVVKTAHGTTYPIDKVLVAHKESDLVIASIDVRDATQPLPLGYQVPAVGERIVVIGNPAGLDQTVSDGIVSAVRPGRGIQVTAPISPGSSGSPVINMKGEVVGVAFEQRTDGQNLNFAIPSNQLLALLAMNTGEAKGLAQWSTETGASEGDGTPKKPDQSKTEAPLCTARFCVKQGGALLYVRQDDFSQVVDRVDAHEPLTILGETLGITETWYMVKTRKSVVGWIKSSQVEKQGR